MIVIVNAREEVAPALSRTVTWMLNAPDEVGIFERTPDAESSAKPGIEPEVMDHMYGCWPPDARKRCWYAVPTTPEGSAELFVIRNRGCSIESEKSFETLKPALSTTWIVIVEVLTCSGVPERMPVIRPSANQGWAAALSTYGGVPPAALKIWE